MHTGSSFYEEARHENEPCVVESSRALIESDHGYADPPTAIPCRIEWVEHLLTNQLKTGVDAVRRLAWQNFVAIVHKTDTYELLPGAFTDIIDEVGKP